MIWKRSTAALAGAALATFITAGSASAATPSAVTPNINVVPCGNRAFVEIWWHPGSNPVGSQILCLANGGVWDLGTLQGSYCVNPGLYAKCWLDKIWTGNNKVQWYGDGRWQPSTPIGKWTTFTFPHTPGGVQAAQIKIS